MTRVPPTNADHRAYLHKVRSARSCISVIGRCVMSNDAKLGLVLGVAIVLVIGLVFFRSDPVEAKTAEPATALKKSAPPATPTDAAIP